MQALSVNLQDFHIASQAEGMHSRPEMLQHQWPRWLAEGAAGLGDCSSGRLLLSSSSGRTFSTEAPTAAPGFLI